ncbi:EARP and GARP complex-interacting protein 1-like isoform X2 [Ptychodera flava]|uniref:EARP and GARP complex-interacting protein 1-like isoform X2 n=1 Tax=Ptychodera flava TaxID=63121 RepID=UPI00396A261B
MTFDLLAPFSYIEKIYAATKMEDDAPVIYGLEFQARALTAHTAETENIRFFVGTQSLKFDNQVHQIDFDDESNVVNKNVYLHKEGEIWHISCSPADKNVLATCYNKTSDSKTEMNASLWRIPADFESLDQHEEQAAPQPLELLYHLDNSTYGNIVKLLWEPQGDGKKLISLMDSHIVLWDITNNSTDAKIANTAVLEGKGQPKLTSGTWNPHHNCTQIATANDTAIRGWDLRSMSQAYCIENAHGQLVRDLEFNPNKQYYLVSCGDDCKVKFWDIRNTRESLTVLAHHSHWVWSVRYNHFHDQLVLTSSSDSRVVLSNIISLSSEPFNYQDNISDNEDAEQERSTEPKEDGVIATYEEHEDSVYTAEWCVADPWLFASLSYDGRLVINHVPRAEKYKILL